MPLAAVRGLSVELDERVIESGNIFEGKPFDLRDSILTQPTIWWALRNPLQPSWGEPYKEVVARMWPAVHRRPRGGRAATRRWWSPTSCRSGSTRLKAEGRRFLHDPRKRHCTLCSLTSFSFDDERLVSIGYSEPAGDLIPVADRNAPFSAGGADDDHKPPS